MRNIRQCPLHHYTRAEVRVRRRTTVNSTLESSPILQPKGLQRHVQTSVRTLSAHQLRSRKLLLLHHHHHLHNNPILAPYSTLLCTSQSPSLRNRPHINRLLFSNRPRRPQRLRLRIPSPSSTPRQRCSLLAAAHSSKRKPKRTQKRSLSFETDEKFGHKVCL